MKCYLTPVSFLWLATRSWTWAFTNAFQHVAPRSNKSPSSLVLFGMTRRSSNGKAFDDGSDSFDVEAARQRLEALVDDLAGNNKKSKDKDYDTTTRMARAEWSRLFSFSRPPDLDVEMPHAPPLTAIERERREAEIRLLSELEDGDNALSDLWTHWFQERGPKAASRLLEAEHLTAKGPRGWDQAEEILRELIESYGVWWAEPVNRLATLYYLQGKLEESEILCKMVLSVKPWHFGALSGIVMVYAALRDADQARQWAARRLPSYAPMGSNRRRSAWVHKAILDAHESLLEAEGRLKETFGKKDKRRRSTGENLFLDSDSWQ